MQQTKGLCSIIIPCWNDSSYVDMCMKALLAQTYKDLELIISDNNSSDDSLLLINKYSDKIKTRIIRNIRNLGFSKAVNIGINASHGEYVMLLNMDVSLSPHFIEYMINELKKDGVGSVSGKLYRFVDETGSIKTIDSTGHMLLVNRSVINRGEEEEDLGQFDDKTEIFGVSGAAGLYKRAMLEDVKVNNEYFDEYFFALYEDTDLDWRALLRGWKCVFVPAATAYHKRRSRGWIQNNTMLSNSKRNKFLSAVKNEHFVNYFIDFPVIFSYELDYILNGHYKNYAYFFLAYIKMLLGLPVAIIKRIAISKKGKISATLFRKYIIRDEYDRRKLIDLALAIFTFILLSKVIEPKYILAFLFTVFFIINPIIYRIKKRDVN